MGMVLLELGCCFGQVLLHGRKHARRLSLSSLIVGAQRFRELLPLGFHPLVCIQVEDLSSYRRVCLGPIR